MSVNRIILIGRISKDPGLETTQSGKVFTKFGLATDRQFSKEKITDWHNCTAWGKTAETIVLHCKKGKEIYIEGRVEYNKPKDIVYTNITVESFHFVGKKE